MLRICSLNMNGIRAAYRKGFADWLAKHQPTIVCMQEVRIQEKDLKEAMRNPEGYQGYFNLAEKPGYSGVALYLKEQPQAVNAGMGCSEFDPEGRIIKADYDNLSVISAYLPSGTSGTERQEAKYRFLQHFEQWISAFMADHQATGREYIICGDWNIAHHEIDLKNWRGNQRTPASYQKNGLGSRKYLMKWAGSMCTVISTPTTVARAIRGGVIVAKHGLITLAGVLIIT